MDTGNRITDDIKTRRYYTEYFLQVGLVYIVAITSLVNITLGNGNQDLWKFLLISFVGYFLPGPTLKKLDKLPSDDEDKKVQMVGGKMLSKRDLSDKMPPKRIAGVRWFDANSLPNGTLKNGYFTSATTNFDINGLDGVDRPTIVSQECCGTTSGGEKSGFVSLPRYGDGIDKSSKSLFCLPNCGHGE